MKNKIKVIGNIYAPGVYYLETTEGKVLYVGSGQEMNDCLSRHLYYLKRGLYKDTNKEILQNEYDKGNLIFRVALCGDRLDDFELGIAEQKHIKLNIDTICNKQTTVKRHTSNKNELSTYKRVESNRGENNPNNKYSEELISEILWLKMNGYKPRQIAKYYKDINTSYISSIGVSKWIYLKPRKPDFINKKAATSANVTTSCATAIAQI